MNYEIKKIAGVDTIFGHMQDSNTVTIEIFVKAGSVYEDRRTNGISHFLEHMFFKGGKKYKTPHAVAEVVDQFGGEFNAYTGDEYAGYYVKCAPEHTHKAVDVLADMLVDAQFPLDEMEREKGVVIQEIKMYEDMPHRLVIDKWKEYFYGDNSYGRSTLGPAENIQAFTQDDLFKHKNDLYTKDNLIVVVAGKIIDQKSLEEQIGELFGRLLDKKSVNKPEFIHTLPEIHSQFYDKKTEQNHIVLSLPGYGNNDERKYAANLLGVILGGTMSSRLFQEIREKRGLCYYVSGSHMSETDSGVYFIRAGISKDRFEFGKDAINEQLDRVVGGDITSEEFQKAVGYMSGKTQMGIESSDEYSSFLGEQYLIKGKIESLEEVLNHYKTLKLEDINKLAGDFEKDKRYTYYIQ